ncbi:MAG: PKD domain-containing protein [Nitrospinae bacterium]|nr:PKD domain-containing protein [Nitrospinota bacterium]
MGRVDNAVSWRQFGHLTQFIAALSLAVVISSCGGLSSPAPKSESTGEKFKSDLAISVTFPEAVGRTLERTINSSNATRALPSYVTGMILAISGDDMETIYVSIPLDSLTAVVYMTPGVRRFDLLVTTNIGLSFTGSVIADISAGSSPEFNFDLVINSAPAINSLSASPSSAGKNSPVSITADVSDLDDDSLSYQWNGGGGSISGSGPSVTFTASHSGSYTVSLTVDDGRGGVTTGSVGVSVANNPPVIHSVSASAASAEIGDTIYLACDATDPDGDTVSYSWSDGAGWSASGPSAIYTVSSGGDKTISCSAADDEGANDYGSVAISVASVSRVNNSPVISSFTVNRCSIAPVNGVCGGFGGWTALAASTSCIPTYFQFICSATDADGDTISYNLEASATDWQSTYGPSNYVLTAGYLTDWDISTEFGNFVYDSVTFKCSASDTGGGVNTVTFTSVATGC